MQSLLCVALLFSGSFALPASQPAYQGQYVTAQAVQPQQYQQPQYQIQYQPQQYRQISQAEFLAAYAPQQTPQVHEPQPEAQAQYQTPIQYRNTQPILGNVERQVRYKCVYFIVL